MPIKVRIPEVLRKLTGGADVVAVEASTVGEMLNALEKNHPGLKERICDDKGNVKRFINIFVNEEDIRFQDNLNTPLSAGADVSILPAIAGGNSPRDKKSSEITRRVYLSFTAEGVTQPIIYHVIKKFDVIPNIRGASVTDEVGIMSVEFTGPREEVDKALDWIRKQGVKVDPIEMNVVEP
ncbi:MAG TPA: ubiquitin-like small modifier protein 1 [Planctomycetota bacterium]|nr:ubiquitin-like small modifier protein 1 [Planctomycetota bacterium]